MKYGKIIEGNLEIKKGDKNDYSEVEEITGYLYIYSEAKLEAPNLQTVGDSLYINSEAKLENLQTVGGSLDIYSEAKLENLQTVGGSLDINSEAKLENLQTVGGSLYINSEAKLEAPKAKYNVKNTKKLAFEFNFNCFLKLGFVFADGILAKLLTKHKNKNGTTVYKVQIVGQTKTSYCIESNGKFAHADTIEQAKEDLKFKFQDIDTSKYEDYTLDTVVTFEDALQMYHDITGACSGGTKHFVENVLKVKKKKYTVRECIELTEGQYNSEKFKEFFMR